MKRQFFSGNTLEQAVMQAARHFGIDPERVAYDQREKKHGFLKVRRRVVIEVDSSSPEKAEMPVMDVGAAKKGGTRASVAATGAEAPFAETFQESEPVLSTMEGAPSSEGDALDDEPDILFESAPLSETASVERAVREILRFVRVQAEVTVERGSDVFVVEISHPNRDDLLDREGRILQAMEYLVPRLVRNWMGQGVPVKIDCEGFRVEREEKLGQLAKKVADQVRGDGRSQSLDPMSPADRRLIHLALADDPDVFTESDGEGYYKRVRILAQETSYADDDGEEYEEYDDVDDVEEDEEELEDDEDGDEYDDDEEYDDEDEFDEDEDYEDEDYEDEDYEDEDYEDEAEKAGSEK